MTLIDTLLKKLKGFNKKPVNDTCEDFCEPIFFLFPSLLKQEIAADVEVESWKKDYLLKKGSNEKYIYEVCGALQIIGISYEKYKRDLSNYTDEKLNEGVGEIIGRNFEIESRLMLRRTLELFLESWYFNNIIEEQERLNAIRFYLLIRNLQAFHKRDRNSKSFCDFPLEFDITAKTEIRNELDNISSQKFFYLESNKDYNNDTHINKLFKPFRSLLEPALHDMPEGLRKIIGESYQIYAETSEVLHGFSGGPDFNLQDYHNKISLTYGRCAILATNILKSLVEIGGDKVKTTEIAQAINDLKQPEVPEAMSINLGDTVLVSKQIKAEVVEVSESDYGCKKYKVKYNDKRGDVEMSFEREWFLFKELEKTPQHNNKT